MLGSFRIVSRGPHYKKIEYLILNVTLLSCVVMGPGKVTGELQVSPMHWVKL
jgi:hypothetical protein